ncbi:hypothetical protein P3X46_034845 [Hevea brasiliensis]|uniref:DUF7903 domain-containing protein n=1 Tax=Hevea brasiliensis TaxID=3981 RepID=A0ABQ9KBC0_HEVBR|nr:uncharacterized protein LOC110642723 [Hevea brasiliensis]XP_057998464.1 uncharacterized protein LOC110642723 [Hevea brasiliensis]XP_057998465.1 uncharacterized protein LOC110642723 [Hevea brasiliensis]KAJ9131945.1 hypothetical protein P3X46_034845 [Hevea brasiliensis]
MAYIPPHKRHSQDKGRPSPTPEKFIPLFKSNYLSVRSQDSKIVKRGKIVNADAIFRWFPVGLSENDQFPSYIHLEPVSVESFERRYGDKPLTLVNSIATEENNELKENYVRSPWVTIAESVQRDLLTSFEILKNEMDSQGLEKVKPTLVARFGKIVFYGSWSPSVRLGRIDKNQVDGNILRQLKRSIYTNVPSSYMENIIDGVVPKVGVDFEEEKDIYHIKLSDDTRPYSTVSCKCRVQADKKLVLYKAELQKVYHMVTDVSCLDKNLDLRLMLYTKRILTAPTDDEMKSIRDLISSAVLDSEVKGGLRWPLGKISSENRYSVIWFGHTITKAYRSPSLRLKVGHADRFFLESETGEVSTETYLKLNGILSELQEQGAESDSVSTMLKDSLRMIWDNFLSCDRFLA